MPARFIAVTLIRTPVLLFALAIRGAGRPTSQYRLTGASGPPSTFLYLPTIVFHTWGWSGRTSPHHTQSWSGEGSREGRSTKGPAVGWRVTVFAQLRHNVQSPASSSLQFSAGQVETVKTVISSLLPVLPSSWRATMDNSENSEV